MLETEVVAPGTLPEAGGGGTLTGTAYHLVDQTIVGSLVVDETVELIRDGRIAIPELGIDMPLSPDGTFRLSNLASGTPHAVIQVTVLFTAPGLGAIRTFTCASTPEPWGRTSRRSSSTFRG